MMNIKKGSLNFVTGKMFIENYGKNKYPRKLKETNPWR